MQEFARRMILAWDPDYTKLTPSEARELENICQEVDNDETVRFEDIDWGE